MQDTRAFYPLYSPSTGKTAGTLLPSVTVAATTSAVASTAFPGNGNFPQIQIANKSASWAQVNFGNLTTGTLIAATVAAGYPVGPGAVVVVTVDKEVNAASVILDSGTGNVIFTRGEGL